MHLVLAAASTFLLVVEADASAPRAEADAVVAESALALSDAGREFRSPDDLSVLPGVAPLVQKADSELERGIRAYVEVELDEAVRALDESVARYEEAGAALWGAPALARAHLYRGFVALAQGDETAAGAAFAEALAIDPTLVVEEGTFAPDVVAAFERARSAFLAAGFRPAPPEVWGGAARRLNADAVLLVRLERTEAARRASLYYLSVDPTGATDTRARYTVDPVTMRALRKGIEAVIVKAEGKQPMARWKKWSIGVGSALVLIFAGMLALAAGQDTADVKVKIPTSS